MDRIKRDITIVRLVIIMLIGLVFVTIGTGRSDAAVVTWDGGGTDGTCGGGAGDGNKWSCGANWSTDSVPTSADVATFNSTSTKNATIDSSISITGIDINTGYTGTITQASGVTITLTTSGFAQDDGTFVGGNSSIDINDGSLTLNSGATFTSTSGTLYIERNLTINSSATWAHNSGTITIDGFTDDSTLSCGSKTFSTFTIFKTDWNGDTTIGSDCSLDLGNSPTIGGGIINNGVLTLGTGTLTFTEGRLTMNSGSTTTFSGTSWVHEGSGSPGVYLNGGTFTANSLTTINIDNGYLVLSSGTFSVSSLTTLYVEGSLDNSGNLLPSGLDVTFDGGPSDDATITCGTATFNSVTINKSDWTADTTIGADCSIDLGNSATVGGNLINNGELIIGTGTFTTVNGGLTMNSGSTTTFSGTTMNLDGAGTTPGFYLNGGTFTGNSMTTLNIDDDDLVLSSGTFNASSLTTVYVEMNLNDTGNLLPSGLNITIDGSTDDTTITCGTSFSYNTLTIAKTDWNGDVTIGSDCDLDLGNNVTVGGNLFNNGALTIGTGTFTINNGGITMNSGSTTSFSGTTVSTNGTGGNAGFYLNGGTFTASNLTTLDINHAGYVTSGLNLASGTFTVPSLTYLYLERDFSNAGNLFPSGVQLILNGAALDDGTITCNNSESFSLITINKTDWTADTYFAGTCSTTGDFTRTDGYVQNSGAAATVNVEGNFSMSTTDIFGGSNLTIKLTGTNAQTVTKNAANTFSSPLVIDKSSNVASLTTAFTTTTAACTVVEGTFNTAGYAFTCGSTFTIEDGGTLRLQGGEAITTPTLNSGSTVEYVGNGDTNPNTYDIKDWSYHHLKINLSDTNDTVGPGVLSSLTIAGNVDLDSGTLQSTATLNVAGNWNNNGGTFDGNSGTVVLNGTSQQITGDTTFYSLTKSVSGTDTLTFEASSTQTIEGTMTLNGAEDELLLLRSSSPETQWEIDPQGTRTIAYLDVQDSNNINASAIIAYNTGSVNSLRNTNWIFNLPGRTINGFTVSLWVKPTSSVVSKAILVKNEEIRLVTDGSGMPLCQIYASSSWQTAATSSEAISTDKWQYVTCTYDKTNIKVYIDGVLKGTQAETNTINDSDNSWVIGEDASTTYGDYSGTVDDFKVYGYAQTNEEIISDMNAGHPAPGSPVGSPVGWWKFDEGYESTAYDSSPQKNNGTITGTTWSNDGRLNKALNFNASDDYVTIGSQGVYDNMSQISISAWIKPNSLGEGSIGRIMDKASSNSPDNGWAYFLYSGPELTFNVDYDTATNLNTFSVDNAITIGEWQHIVVTWDGTSNSPGVHHYVNGVDVTDPNGVSGVGARVTDASQNLLIGDSTFGNRSFDGLIDEVKLYNFVLSPDQVKSEYNQGKSQVLGSLSTTSTGLPDNSSSREYCVPGDTSTCNPPVAEWKMDENSGTTAYDTTGNSNNLTLTNSPEYKNAKYGSGIYFGGSNAHLTRADDSDFDFGAGGSFTLEGWFKHSTASVQEMMIVKYNEAGYKMLMESDGDITCGIDYDSTWTPTDYVTSTAATYDDNNWHHVMCVKNANTSLTLYIDGLLVGTPDTSLTNSTLANTDPLYIGIDADGTSNDWIGYMDDFKIYNYARTPAQIAWEYNRGKPIAWWKMDECSGATLNDSSGNGSNVTIYPVTLGNASVGTCSGSAGTMWADGASGKINSSLDFDGIDDYASMTSPAGSILDITKGEITIAAWTKLNGTSSGLVVEKGDTSANPARDQNFGLWRTENGLYFQFNSSGGGGGWHGYDASDINTINPGGWNHIAITYTYGSGSSIKAYLNGKVISGTWTLGNGNAYVYASNSEPVQIGARKILVGYNQYYNGQLDDIRIYNYALTDQQINDIYNGGAVRFSE